MTVEVPFPEAFVINLDERTDRWATISASCKDAGINPTRLSAIRAEKGWIGCARSHQACVRQAKALGLPWVLIIEDDAVFGKDSINQFKDTLSYLWNKKEHWHRFSGGPHFGVGAWEPKIKIIDHDFHIFSFRGLATHFDLINYSAYDLVLEWEPEINQPIDLFYLYASDRQHKPIRSLCSYPPVATQSASESDIEPEHGADMPRYAAYSKGLLLDQINRYALAPDPSDIIPAVHPEWSGELVLSRKGTVVQHGGVRSFGKYFWKDGVIFVNWYLYGQEKFILKDGKLISEEILNRV